MKTLNKAFILGKIYNVMEADDFRNDFDEFLNYYGNNLALHYKNYILPIYLQNNANNYVPGVYFDGLGFNVIFPESGDEYSDSHLAMFGDAQSFQDVLQAKEKIYKDEYNHLVSSDDVFIPHIDQSQDSALMYAVKSAIAAKECNINNYAERFGSDFNNDKRKFNGNTITAGKAESILSNTDVRVSLVVQDMTPNVANPIGKTLVFPWIGDGVHDDDYVNYIQNAINASGPIKL